MPATTSVTQEQAIAWFEAFSTAKPKQETAAGPYAYPVRSLQMMPATDGIAIRLIMESGGQADLFFNAVVAKALMDAITSAAAEGGWMNKDGEIIVLAPEGPSTFRPAN